MWLFKNIIISGCVIYPVSKLCFENLEWSNISEANAVAQENEAWTKSWPDFKNTNGLSQKEYSSKFIWLSTWSKTHLKKIIKILIPYFIALIFVYLIIHFKYRDKNIPINIPQTKEKNYLIILMILFTLVWFAKVPVYRYGYSYFISAFALTFAYICTKKFIKDTSRKFFIFLIIFVISAFVIKNMFRIINPENKDKNYIPKIKFVDESQIKKIQLRDFIYYESNNMCGYNYFPCTHYKGKNLKIKKFINYYTVIISD